MIERIREALRRNCTDAILLTDEKNRRYVTGFHSTAGAVYVSKRRAVFYTDFRYIEAAKSAITNCEVRQICSGETYSSVMNMLCREDGVRTIALEDDCLTYKEYCSWEKALHAKVEPQHDLMNILRTVKSKDELERIIRAQRIAEKAFEEILNDIKPGVSEREIAARLTYKMLHYGAENMSFDPIVVSGTNSSRPHGVPSDKLIENGDFVTMDFGCIYEGYCSDMTR
ncbi:MAG: aminopeptidase P family protein, partial [Butyricicoccus sp.]|nr:aminopeptidase P family protein [Butyricicoccus sp.]